MSLTTCPGAPICMGDCHACAARRAAIQATVDERAPRLVTDHDRDKRHSVPDLVRDFTIAERWFDESQASQQEALMAGSRVVERLAEVLLEQQGIPATLIRRVAEHQVLPGRP